MCPDDIPDVPPKREIDFGVQVDPKKTEVVKDWPRPLFVSNLQNFLGLVGYYRNVVVHSGPESSLVLDVKAKKDLDQTSFSSEDYAKLNIQEMLRLHGVPFSIISDRCTQFISLFWKSFQKGLHTQVELSTTFHPQTDGQAESTIQILEYMLRACVIDFKGNWDDLLTLIKFSYNNSYHSSIWMALFEALYGRICRSPLGWFEVDEVALIGP
ncbi:hypothetical protein MTR67_047828 [Solanum verrucosum]|uniref:Integrase catalytic domain-containing protein n=1 Tax=Solanum verrucosum TaxID=315347 RepID=A0AAF0UWI0_SOLVR|nr:hypothetical protein MTR67_047828 [Solanum verrucosum]